MNMIPLVRATEPGRAQLVNRRPSLRIVVYRTVTRLECRLILLGILNHGG